LRIWDKKQAKRQEKNWAKIPPITTDWKP